MIKKNKAENKWILHKPSDSALAPDPRGFGAVCFDKLKQFGNKIAQVDAETGETQTYAELLLNTICVAQELSARGITSQDVVCLCTNNQINSCTPFLAATYLLAKVTSLDPSLSFEDMKYMLNLTKPRIIFCILESVETLALALANIGLKCDLVIFGDSQKYIPFKHFLIQKGNEKDFKPKSADSIFDTAFIYFSSGTTGRPKGICLHHYGVLYAINFARTYIPSKMTLFFTSSYWITHLTFLSLTLFQGGCRLVCKEYNENSILDIIQKFQVTFMFLPPTMTYGITSNLDYKKYDLTSLEILLVGGSILMEKQLSVLQQIFPTTVIMQGYGLTELTGVFSRFDPKTDRDLINSKTKSCGKMVAGHSCKVVDPDTSEILGPNRQGELLLKSKSLTNGYYNNPEETKKCFDEDGFLHTGDVVYYDDDGCFYIVGRIKEMFKYRSWHIVPVELESILLTHPDIKEAVVIGFPHEEDGDRPMAVIVPNQGTNITEHEVLNFFNSKVIDRKHLRGGVKFVKSIPKTTSGKYNRYLLREKLINNEI